MNLAKFKPYYLYRIIKWKLGNRSPLGVGFKLTYRCPLNCIHCSWNTKDEDELSTEEWKKIIDYSRKSGCVIALFEGGEPTLRDDLEILIQYAKEKGMITELFTNAYFPLKEYSPDIFWISVDGIGKKHDEIRGKGAFQKLKDNIEPLDNKKIITWTTISKKNMFELEEIRKTFSNKVEGMMFHFFYPYEDILDYSLTPEERRLVGLKLMDLKSSYNIIPPKSYLIQLKENYKVYPWINMTVSPNGNIHQGCPVEQIQGEFRCTECYMACCRIPSLAYHFKRDSIRSLYKLVNF